MTDPVRRLLEEAKKLSLSDRAVLISALTATIEDQEDVDREWLVEVERRVDEVLRGEDRGSSWGEVRSRIEAQLRDAQ